MEEKNYKSDRTKYKREQTSHNPTIDYIPKHMQKGGLIIEQLIINHHQRLCKENYKNRNIICSQYHKRTRIVSVS